MEVKALYEMARAATEMARAALSSQSSASNPFERYSGYLTYVQEYNALVPHVVSLFGKEAEIQFQLIILGKFGNLFDTPPAAWRGILEHAATRLGALTAYLATKLGDKDSKIELILDVIKANLRASMYEDPRNEREVQNVLEIIFRTKSLDYRREKVTIDYSSKRFVPDFTFDSLDLALEAKLCKSAAKEKALIDEINADIPAYKTRYNRIVFVVYDLGWIRDEGQFRSGIEGNPNVYVLIIKK